MAGNLHISINAEKVFEVAGVPISNSILTTWIVLVVILLLASKTYKEFKKAKFNDKPSRFQSLMELIIEGLFNLVKSTAGENKKARSFFPIVSTFFIFIILSNWIGLFPGVGTIGFREKHEVTDKHVAEESHEENIALMEEVDTHETEEELNEVVDEHAEEEYADEAMATADEHEEENKSGHDGPAFVPYFRGPTADLNTTLALAFSSIVLVQFVGFKFLGLSYSGKFINFSGPIDFFVGILELFSEISKVISFAFRLFGNMFAGEVLLAVIAFLVPLFAPLPFLGLEIFVGFIQALVFSMLTLVFMNLATISHSQEH
ncbi:F0F1 ATP synthase subunit A [Patescibacteria group bacterium]